MIFVFGSNKLGIHGRGAAKTALAHGAMQGRGFGHYGDSFAIPTCAKPAGMPGWQMKLGDVRLYIEKFVDYAHYHPELKFKVTKIGCGLAGWTDEQMAQQFYNSPHNCYFDLDWQFWLPKQNFWGTFNETP